MFRLPIYDLSYAYTKLKMPTAYVKNVIAANHCIDQKKPGFSIISFDSSVFDIVRQCHNLYKILLILAHVSEKKKAIR